MRRLCDFGPESDCKPEDGFLCNTGNFCNPPKRCATGWLIVPREGMKLLNSVVSQKRVERKAQVGRKGLRSPG